jgi:hypothetical protein
MKVCITDSNVAAKVVKKLHDFDWAALPAPRLLSWLVAGPGGLASGARVLQSPKVDVQSMNRQKSRDSWHWASHMAFDCKVE